MIQRGPKTMAFRRPAQDPNNILLDDTDDLELRQDIAAGRYSSPGNRPVVDPYEAALLDDDN